MSKGRHLLMMATVFPSTPGPGPEQYHGAYLSPPCGLVMNHNQVDERKYPVQRQHVAAILGALAVLERCQSSSDAAWAAEKAGSKFSRAEMAWTQARQRARRPLGGLRCGRA